MSKLSRDSRQQNDTTAVAAANVARNKISSIYKNEPDVDTEIQEVKETKQLSKHQKYMQELSGSGRSLAEIQTAWHKYYSELPDKEKHEVWQEFYDFHEKNKHTEQKTERVDEREKNDSDTKPAPKTNNKSTHNIGKNVARKISGNGRITKKQHLQSILFGLGIGSIVVLIILFGFFNERFIAPFITPSKNVSSTPIIIDPNSNVAAPGSKVIIPKINVEIPVVYDSPSVVNARTADELEAGIQKSLEDGVVHHPNTEKPGELGNVAIVGHSSNNIFNSGKFKFAFVLLSKLDEGDTFYLTRNEVRYTYKIFEKRIVPPTDVSVLENTSKPASATLITCDPPGTSLNRLIVVGEQISPSPSKNQKAKPTVNLDSTETIPGNAPSLWSRFTNWIF